MGQKIEIDADWLREKYVDEFMTAGEIAELTKVSERTIRRRLKEHKIEIRTNGPRNKIISKERLQREYVEKGRSARDMAEGEDYSRNHVHKSLEYHGIEIRGRVQAIWEKHGNTSTYRTHPRGHVMIGSGGDGLYLHQLLAIAEGTDPHKLFGGGAVVHHKNGVPWDNRPENLEVLESQAKHMKIHYAEFLGKVNNSSR